MIAFSTIVLAYALAVSATKSLTVKVAAPATVASVDEFDVSTVITNTGDETLKLLTDPRTPLSPFATNTFVVTNTQGVYPDFTGVKVRYIPEVSATSEESSSFTVLAPGASVEVSHEVGRYYNFTSTGAGAYTFEPVNVFNLVGEDGTLSSISAKTESATVDLSGRLSTGKSLKASSLGGGLGNAARRSINKRATFSSCSSTRQTQINAAITASSGYASNSITHLNANPSGSTLQTTWYGTFSSSHHSVTLSSFQGLVSEPASWNYDCTCTDSDTYAYVYPSDYGYVYLCGYYWNAPATGSGSRADTIIHEGSHFPEILGTDDYTYGETSCKALAKSNPTEATYNADNHAFFSVYASQ